MANKLHLLNKLFRETIEEISTDVERWQGFLKVVAYNYRLRYDEQLLVYAQRPEAEAVLEIERWNRYFGRWVNRGAKGIAVFEEDSGIWQRLKYYFDISDTRPSKHSKPVPLWEVKLEHHNAVIETLESTYGEIPDKKGLAIAILFASENAAMDHIQDYSDELLRIVQKSHQKDIIEPSIQTNFRRVVANSISYILMTRLGVDPSKYLSATDFEGVQEFNTRITMDVLGSAISDIAEMGLAPIAKTVQNLKKTEAIRTFGKSDAHDYNVGEKAKGFGSKETQNDGSEETQRTKTKETQRTKTKETQRIIGKKNQEADVTDNNQMKNEINLKENHERSSEDGNHIHNARRLSTSKSDLAEAGKSGAREIRNVTEEVPERAQENNVLSTSDGMYSEPTLDGSGEHSPRETRDVSRADEKGAEHYRGVESERHDELGTEDESDSQYGGGDYTEGVDLRLEWYDRKKEDKSLPFFGRDEEINAILLTTPHLKVGRDEICEFFESNTDKEVRKDYIRSIFNNEFTEITIEGQKRVGYKAYENVLRLWEGSYLGRTGQSYYDWGIIATHFDSLRLLGELYDSIKPLPSAGGQMSLFVMSTEKPQIVFPQEIIDLVLAGGSSFNEGKFRIYHQFEQNLSSKSNVEFLKKEYGTGGRSSIQSGTGIGEMHDAKGIRLYRGFGKDNPEILLKWPVVVKRIKELIEAERYLNPDEVIHYPFWLEDKEISRIANEEILAVEEALSETNVEKLPTDERGVRAEKVPKKAIEILEESTEETIDVPEENNVDAKLISNFELKKTSAIKDFTLYPGIPEINRNQYVISNDNLGTGTLKEKYQLNVAAIRLLQTLDNEKRLATPSEQEILVQYVGWGGLSDVFDESKTSWSNEYMELKSLLSEVEYSKARESTLTAFYTPPIVIRSIYNALEQFGFKNGNILEPSVGTGNFVGMLPSHMQESKVYGVELDRITGQIAQQLYQKSTIAIQGFEESNLPDSFFDVAIGNVPFGDFKVVDRRYDKHNFLIHDYFFGKTLDKVRPGGIVAFITSKGTLDKENPKVRRYIAQRAQLIGAIRLPNNTFQDNAGTQVTGDIIFLQKRDRIIDIEPDWVYLSTDENGIKMNHYFVEHPEMILGEMKMVSGRFGPEVTCQPFEGHSLEVQLAEAISNLEGAISDFEVEGEIEVSEGEYIHADPNARNFSYCLVEGNIYFRENSLMSKIEVSATAKSRIKGLIDIRDCTRRLIEYQTEDYPDEDIEQAQGEINSLYDSFTKKYGLISSRANSSAFSMDSSYSLLGALEVVNENGELERKADLFFKRTIKPRQQITSVDTATEALSVSMAEKAKVDMPYMMELCNKSEEAIASELEGIIFVNHRWGLDIGKRKYQSSDEYLSGNVREKLSEVIRLSEANEEHGEILKPNLEALQQVQPVDLSASEISVRLGATWLPKDVVEEFMYHLFGTPSYQRWNIKVYYSEFTGEWSISGKSYDKASVKVNSTYGTKRVNGYKIFEETLNLRDVRVFDYYEEDGKKKSELNKKETAIAQGKQEQIKEAFKNWIWEDPKRREKLTKLYNEKFNSMRPREYDGSCITFNGMNTEISLRTHQINAIAHVIYGGNTLLAHVVGAGKTFEMVAASMEMKRLGLCHKSLFVVPNHLTEQWGAEFLQLYPSANILVATKKDFETKNRKKFCGRIATGEFDAVIIGHSQFERIPMSVMRQRAILEKQIEEITYGIDELKRSRGERFSIKQLEKTKKSISVKLEKLNDQRRKDDVVTFEELGVDRLFVDESQFFKNLYLYTKMRNVGGIAQTEAQKSSDLFMKCRYLDELTGGRGIIFATGTPISNSMVELYTIQRYLQYHTLEKHGLIHFDAWASTFGETTTAIELSPEGTGFRAKTRFAKFYNLPELMAMFKEVADIKTADMLNLPVPKAVYTNISVKPSEHQKEMVENLSERAERIRNRMVDSTEDNMLLITSDGRKLALDQRIINDLLPDFEGSKLNACVENAFQIWEEGREKKLTQLIFSDLSTPKNDDSFNIYDDIREKLKGKGIPEEEIKFIHEANSEVKKKELFTKIRKGDVRILIGSTQKMGAGTNIQDRLIALHDVDVPWRPSDLQQRAGRIVRQGNHNPEVKIFRYVTEQTFDSYLYQTLENKQKFISQIMTSKSPVRVADDVDEQALSYAEIKMLATGNPLVKEKMDLDIQVSKLKLLRQSHMSQKYELEDKLIGYYPKKIQRLTEVIRNIKADKDYLKQQPKSTEEKFCGMTIQGKDYQVKADAGKALIEICKVMVSPDLIDIGKYRGFEMQLFFETFSKEYKLSLKHEMSYLVTLGKDGLGNIIRIDNVLDSFDKRLTKAENQLTDVKEQQENAKEEVKKPFVNQEELKQKSIRLDELNILLNMDSRQQEEIIDSDDIENCEVVENYRETVGR